MAWGGVATVAARGLGDARADGVATADVGGAAHTIRMDIFDTCERCDGSGADPVQNVFDDEFSHCRDCHGDGVTLSFDELLEEPLRLSA